MVLQDQLSRWVAAGIIDPEQAAQIQQAESQRSPAPTESPAVTWVVIGYLGAALALIAGLFLVATFGEELASWTGVFILATLAVLLAGAGFWLVGQANVGLQRLGDFAWLLATAAAGGAAGVLTVAVLEWDEPQAPLAVSATVLVVAAGFWVRRPHVLEHVALYGGIVATIMSGLAVIGDAADVDVGPVTTGLTIWAIGAVWSLLGWAGVLPPQWGAFLLGIATMYVGGSTVFGSNNWWILLGVVTVAAVLLAAARLENNLLLGLGVLGLFIFVPQALAAILGDEAGPVIPLVLLLGGMVLLALAIRKGRQSAAEHPTEAHGPQARL